MKSKHLCFCSLLCRAPVSSITRIAVGVQGVGSSKLTSQWLQDCFKCVCALKLSRISLQLTYILRFVALVFM